MKQNHRNTFAIYAETMKNMLHVALILLSFLLSASASHSDVRGPRGDYVENENDAVKDGRRRTKSNSKSGAKLSGSGDFAPPGDGRCVICASGFKDNKPTALTFGYNPVGMNSQFQSASQATCQSGKYPETATLHVENKEGRTQSFEVKPGMMEFVLDGPFDSNTLFSFFSTTDQDHLENPDHLGDCTVHTSCSAPLVQGDQIGPFIVLAGGVCPPDDGMGPPGETPEECEICSPDFKNKPITALTLEYKTDGKNSKYQSDKKASCDAGPYPATVTLQIENKDGEIQTFVGVKDGSVLELEGPFDVTTDFTFVANDEFDCDIHTSCSAPLITGDQIGPFLILGGEGPIRDCEVRTDPPSENPSALPSPCPSVTPSTNPSANPSATPLVASENPSAQPSAACVPAPPPAPSNFACPPGRSNVTEISMFDDFENDTTALIGWTVGRPGKVNDSYPDTFTKFLGPCGIDDVHPSRIYSLALVPGVKNKAAFNFDFYELDRWGGDRSNGELKKSVLRSTSPGLSISRKSSLLALSPTPATTTSSARAA